MKILWFSHFIPYPPRGGSHQRSYHLLRQAAKRHEVHLVAFNLLAEPQDKLESYKQHLLTYCSSVEFWELPLRWKGGHWWGRLVLSPWMRQPFSPRAFWSLERESVWRRILMQNPGALLHLDSSDLALYTEVSAGFRKVLNHHNCESAMLWRRAKVNRNPISIAFLRSQAGKLERLEREVCHRFNVNLTVSSEDSVLLQKINPQAHFHVVENGTDTDYFQPLGLAEEPNSLVFAGSLDWYPNQSALQYFRAEIWPELRRTVSDIRLEMAGRNPAEWMTKWAEEDSRVTLTPNPEDIRPSMDRGAVFLCPIVDGGGTRLKLLDAMAMGKAIVTTSIGCEGLRAVPGRELMVADSPADFSAAVLRLLRDEPLRWKLQQAAREFVVQEYSWNRIGEQLEEAYQEAIGSSESGSLRVSAKHAPVM